MGTLDQGFRDKAFKAQLVTTKGPYNEFPNVPTGSKKDSAHYIVEPGVNFMRPWLAVRNGPAFQWPLGLEGFTLAIDATLGIHKYIGDNQVTVDVIHAGEERFTLTGNFPGNSAPDLTAALRTVVYHDSGRDGKVLWLPEIVTYAQLVQVAHFEAVRAEEGRGRDMTYTIEFVKIGKTDFASNPNPVLTKPQPTRPPKGTSPAWFKVNGKYNTLRKIAKWKYGSASKWRAIYNLNSKWFIKRNIKLAKAPDYHIPIGTRIYF
jgi:hypothetical protein